MAKPVTFLVSTLAVFASAAYAGDGKLSDVRKQISAASEPCAKKSVEIAQLPKSDQAAKADEAIEQCMTTLSGLSAIGKNNKAISPTDKRFLYYTAGNSHFMLAGVHLMKNAAQLNKKTCDHAMTGKKIWDQVEPVAGSKLEHQISNSEFANNITSSCEKAIATMAK